MDYRLITVRLWRTQKTHMIKSQINPDYSGFELFSRINRPLLSCYRSNEVMTISVMMRPGFNGKLTRYYVTVG